MSRDPLAQPLNVCRRTSSGGYKPNTQSAECICRGLGYHKLALVTNLKSKLLYQFTENYSGVVGGVEVSCSEREGHVVYNVTCDLPAVCSSTYYYTYLSCSCHAEYVVTPGGCRRSHQTTIPPTPTTGSTLNPAPVVTTPAPGVTTPTPVVTTPTPVVTSPAPVVTTPAPVVTTPAPVVTTPAPVVTTPAPVVTTPTPVVTTPAPVVTTPTPVVTSPAPVVTTPTPVVTTPTPVVTTPAPVVTTPTPVVTTPTPVVTSPAPVVTTPTPVVTTPELDEPSEGPDLTEDNTAVTDQKNSKVDCSPPHCGGADCDQGVASSEDWEGELRGEDCEGATKGSDDKTSHQIAGCKEALDQLTLILYTVSSVGSVSVILVVVCTVYWCRRRQTGATKNMESGALKGGPGAGAGVEMSDKAGFQRVPTCEHSWEM